jgi:hypothetical protein
MFAVFNIWWQCVEFYSRFQNRFWACRAACEPLVDYYKCLHHAHHITALGTLSICPTLRDISAPHVRQESSVDA